METDGSLQYSTVAIAVLIAIGLALLAQGIKKPAARQESPPAVWAQYRAISRIKCNTFSCKVLQCQDRIST